MPIVLKNCLRLRRLGVFIDYAHAVDLPNFKQFNLIYGFNGSGKTTLSRIIRSIEAGRVSTQLPRDGEFTIEFSDGALSTQGTLDDIPNKSVAVFNEDFVEENLRWRDGKASPVYFIGKEQAQLSLLLDRLTGRVGKREKLRADFENVEARIESEFRTFKTNLARLIAEELNLGRRYTATQLDADYLSVDVTKLRLLSNQERHEKKILINKVAPGVAIGAISAPQDEVFSILSNVKALCEQSTAAAVIAELQQHAAMLKWARDGLEYHLAHSVATCLFCGNELSSERLTQLQHSIDDRFAEAIAAVEKLKAKIAAHEASIRALREAMPARADFDESLAEAYQSVRAALFNSLAALEDLLSSASVLLAEKGKTPNLRIPTENLDLGRAQTEVDI